MKTTEEITQQRRLDGLKTLTLFTQDPNVPRELSLQAAHDLLSGFFQNSHWQTAWYCITRAARISWTDISVSWRLWYYRRMLGLNEAQIAEKFEG